MVSSENSAAFRGVKMLLRENSIEGKGKNKMEERMQFSGLKNKTKIYIPAFIIRLCR